MGVACVATSKVEFKVPLSCVNALVLDQAATMVEACVATSKVAFKGPLSCVNALVRGQVATLLK